MCRFFFQAEDGIRDRSPSRGLGDVYKRQVQGTTQTTTTTQGEEKETSVIKTDAMGRETENTSKDRKGNILSSTETSYDFMGRAIQTKVTSDGVTQTESKTYDDNGTVATETSASGIKTCLLYTSDAADEEDSVDLGGRRHTKKKKKGKMREIGKK